MTSYQFKAPKRLVNRVFIHCSASDNPDHDNVRTMRDWHRAGNGWSDVGYHFYVRKSGLLEPGRDLEKIPAAQSGHNLCSIAICLGGLKHFTEEQFSTLRRLCHQIHDELPLVTFHGHCEVNPGKTCPVFDYRAVLGLNAKGQLT